MNTMPESATERIEAKAEAAKREIDAQPETEATWQINLPDEPYTMHARLE